MTALLRAEGRKILATRSTLVEAAFVVVYPALAILPSVFAPKPPEVDGDTILQLLRGGAGVLTLAALLLGILAVTSEYRHGTVVPSLLVAPRRGRFLASKLGSQMGMAAVLGLAVSAVGLAIGTTYLATRDVAVDILSGDVVVTVAAVVLVVSLYAAAGVGVGALVKNQTAAVTGALVWVFVVENAIPILLRNPGLKRWLPEGMSDRLLHLADPAAGAANAWLALVMFAGLAVVLAGAAVVATKTSDVH
jgi:ABC-2 type transport system permease protein